ncbi:MAG: response regulator, partial [Oscillospiraceae bacterium]
MYKILLVDDEPLIRRSMMKTINDADGEYFVCDQAGDGLDGIAKITEHKPDIIITDICMNRMTGLEMIEKIKNVVPNAKIIILTGYRDFEYAQKAIQLGAFGFILKPIKNAEIVELLSKAAESIDKERWQMQKNRTIEELSSNNISYIQEKILGDMLCETLTDDINSRYKIFIEDYGIEINCFNLVLIEILEHYTNNVEEKEVDEFLGNILNKDDYYYIFLDENIRAIILKNDENKYSKKDLSDLFNHLLSKINEKYNVNANIAISMIGNTKNDFFMLYQSSKKALSYIKTLGENIVIAFSDILGYDENRNICDELLKAKEELCDGIENNSENEIKNALEKLEDISKSTDINNINL